MPESLERDSQPICKALGCTRKATVGTLTSRGEKVFCEEHFRRYAHGDYPQMKSS